jgi:ADP-ribosylglycohydrolase
MSLDLPAGLRSLEGLSVGDSFGQASFGQDLEAQVATRTLLPGPWMWTDDTAQAAALLSHLHVNAKVALESWAQDLARTYSADPSRGYGGSAHRVLRAISAGQPWREASAALFSGQGSMGNGAAMRVAPLGAVFHSHPERLIHEAGLSALPTHAHPEASAGAIAVALASAHAAGGLSGAELLPAVIAGTPDGETRTRLQRAAELLPSCSIQHAATVLGNGLDMLTQHTVPLCLWIASRNLGSFEQAMWETLAAGGDRDTTCAIVGGVVGVRCPPPAIWTASREALPV